MTDIIHPAKFTDSIMAEIALALNEYCPPPARVFDNFAGVGTVHELQMLGYDTYGIEIEPEWAAAHGDTQQGDAVALPFLDGTMNALVTSPTYSNRFADSHTAKDGSLRRSYTHDLRRQTGDETRTLADNNTGKLHWGDRYWRLHEQAWAEASRVLADDGVAIVNLSDYIKAGKVMEVVKGHRIIWHMLGWDVVKDIKIETPRMRYGANSGARVEHEHVLVLRRTSE